MSIPGVGNHVTIEPDNWTKVLWGVEIVPPAASFDGVFSGPAIIEWRRYSASPPFYTAGQHDTANSFGAVLLGPYTDFWFYSPTILSVGWDPS